MWKKYLPSKKVVAYLIIPLIFLLVLLLWNIYLEKDENSDYDKLVSSFNNVLEDNVDSDQDGLNDWEEELIGTDKEKKDTDGDGLSDSFEIQTGSDPLDPLNKNKKKVVDLTNYNDYSYLTDPDLTVTDRVAVQFLEEGLKLKKSGMSFNKEAQIQVVNKILNQNTINVDLTKFDLNDIKVGNFPIKQFVDDFNSTVSGLQDEVIVDEAILLVDYMESKNKERLEQIINNIKIYNKYLDRLLEVSVPDVIKKEYLNYINAVYAYIEVNKIFANIDKDPVSVVLAMSISKDINNLLKNRYLELLKKIR